MKTLKRVLTLTLALMLTLALLAPAAAATESDTEDTSYFTFSNDPVGYAIVTTGNNYDTKALLTMIVPDGTICTVIVPKGGSLYYTYSEVIDFGEGNVLTEVDGGFDVYEAEELTTKEISGDRFLCQYIVSSGDGSIVETANFVTQSILDTITANVPASVEMVSADLAMTAKTMQLVDGWAVESVDKAVSEGLTAAANKADLRENITRGEFAAVAVRLYEAMSGESAPEQKENPFSDVNIYGSEGKYILQAYGLGIVNGTNAEGTLFDPDGLVTREQAAVMLARAYEKLGGTIPSTSATTFADDGKVSGYAKSAVAFMADKGIVGGVGDNQFNPQGNAKCEEALIIALRMLENLK